jgi:hypothetical protein
MTMKNNPNKKTEYFGVATSFLVTTTLHAAGIPPIDITLSSGVGTNIINTSLGQHTIVEYKIQDVIGKPPSRTWLWSSPVNPYISRVNSLHAPDCSTYNQPNANPNSFMLPPSGFCYFAVEVDGTKFANTSQSKTATYRPVFSNSGAIEYGPCLSEQLHITLGATILPFITVGTYFSGAIQRPLLAVSQNLGDSWIYPDSINAPVFTPTNPNQFEDKGVFYGASCNSSLCIAVGKGEDTLSRNRPLMALSKDAGNTWTYPQQVNAPVFQPDNVSWPFINSPTNRLNSASCTETLCIAAGTYRGNNRPLLTYSQNYGDTWIYPSSVTMPNLAPLNYANGGNFNSTACSNSICIAVGGYNTALPDINRPLLVQSTNSGNSWEYPLAITDPQFLTNQFLNFSDLRGASCSGNTCIAVGLYTSTDTVVRPLLAITQNAGTSWSYPESITNVVFTPANPNPFVDLGVFNDVSCINSTCVAVGSYNDGTIRRPLLAYSQDLGSTWIFPPEPTAPLFTPASGNPYDHDGQFLSVSCTSSICIAVGSYVDDNNRTNPLLAQSLDSGVTWVFPYSITQPVFMPNDTFPFQSDGMFNSAECKEDICIASGSYVDATNVKAPLLAISKDKGVTWLYSEDISAVYFTPLPDVPLNGNPFDDNGQLNATAGGKNASYLPNSLKFINPGLVHNHSRAAR